MLPCNEKYKDAVVELHPLISHLKTCPQARRMALVRASSREIVTLLEGVFISFGLPKEDGRWSPALAHDLKNILDKMQAKINEATYEEVTR